MTSPSETSAFDQDMLQATGESARSAIARAGNRATALVEAWVGAKNAAAVVAVAEDDGAPGPARKAARRGLNVLKARRVPIPERSHVARIPGDAVEGFEAWFLPPDGAGAAIVMIGERWRSGKHRVLQAFLREGIGLVDLRFAELSRAQLKTSFEDTARRAGFPPVPVALDWARARIAAAKAENAKSGAVLPLNLETHADLLGPVPPEPPPHPVDAAGLDVGALETRVVFSAELHNEPELRSFLPDGASVQSLLLAIGEKVAGIDDPGDPNEKQKRVDVAIAEAIDAATDRFFSPEVRERLAARMKDGAISVLAREGKERAAYVMATAEAAVRAGLITQPPHEVPFLRAFFQKALAIVASQSGGRLEVPVPNKSEGAST